MSRNHPQTDVERITPRLAVVVLFLAGLGVGCSQSTRPPLGLVHGKVALDGKPLAGAAIAFLPDGPGRESTAFTDDDGRYALNYIRDIEGAAIGWHTVRISTGDPWTSAPELVPARYRVKSELRREVVEGENEIDFDLPSN